KKDLLMTNNHVVAGLCGISPHSDPQWRLHLGQVIDAFNDRWASTPEARPCWDPAEDPGPNVADAAGRIVRAHLHPSLDMAVLETDGVANSARLAIPLAAGGPRHAARHIYTLGYPAVAMNAGLHPALIRLLFSTDK